MADNYFVKNYVWRRNVLSRSGRRVADRDRRVACATRRNWETGNCDVAQLRRSDKLAEPNNHWNYQSMNDAINRRIFLKHAGAAGLGLSVAGYFGCSTADTGAPMPFATGRAIGANDKLTVAVIGTNGRGLAHIECLTGAAGGRDRLYLRRGRPGDRQGHQGRHEAAEDRAEGAKDFRKLLEDKSLDAVTIATPDHWHAPMAILALAAGKHVYVEKPCSHNPREGELLVAGGGKSKRVLPDGQPAALVSQHPAGGQGDPRRASSARPTSAALV